MPKAHTPLMVTGTCAQSDCEPTLREGSLRVGLVEVKAVDDLAARLYGLQQQAAATDAHEHRVVGGHGGGCQLAIARWIQPPAASPAHHVGHSPYGHGALIDVIVAREDYVHPMLHEERLQVLPHPLVAAVSRGTVGRPVQERNPPEFARGG